MKKLAFLLLGLMAFAAMAQTNPKFSYQSVLRDSNNRLYTNGSNITLKFEVMNASNNVIYTETHTGLTTNSNGLLTTLLGDTTKGIGQFWAVEWYHARVRTTVTFDGQTLVSPIEYIYAVPYAIMSEQLNPNGVTMKEIYYVIDTTKQNIRSELADTAYVLRTIIQQTHDTLQAHIDTASAQIREALADTAASIRDFVNDTLGHYLMANQLCDSIKECGTIKDI